MKTTFRYRYLATLLLFALPAFPQVPDFAAHGAFVAIVVTDLDASVNWYETNLGLHEVKRGKSPRLPAETVVLAGHNLFVELIHHHGKQLPRVDNEASVPRLLKAGAIVESNDFDAIVVYVQKRGIDTAVFEDKEMGARSFLLRDNEGNLIQFFTKSVIPILEPQFSTIEFPSLDELKVTADLYTAGEKNAPTIVLVHQSGGSRGEYRQIAPHLLEMGFNALAIDSRWGDRDRWNGVINETAARYGTPAVVSTGDVSRTRPIQDASADDIRAALAWLDVNGYTGARLLWGSSISSNLVLKVAADPKQRVTAVLSFSPGEYHPDQPNEMKTAVSELRLPTLIACGADNEELQTSKPIFDAIPGRQKVFYHATNGRHGSSILMDDPKNWTGIEPFLNQFRPSQPGKSKPN